LICIAQPDCYNPFDRLDFLFDGEELLYSARLWTHGWDSFAPSSEVLWHRYDRMSGGLPAWRFWSVPGANWAGKQAVSVRRVLWMLRVPKRGGGELMVPLNTTEAGVVKDADKYGLGTERTLEDLWRYAELDLSTKNDQRGICHKYQ
jgi:UDP-GlcNAc:polypeptide alpha-N-acetylglucosaminyltransferase